MVAGLGTAAVKTAADFDTGMSKVAAISGATGKDLDALREKAREMGSKTKFSATEAAAAMEYMAMAGWKTEDMLGGIEGIMNLAAASGEDLATTSDIVTDALTAFGLTAKDSWHFADVLAAASSNANTNVSMMGETFKYAAPIAGALGFSVEDTAEAIGLMANAGIKGSQAGTSLRTIMNNLAGEVKICGANLGEVTIQTTNADGSMRELSDILADCRAAFSQLSESEQAEVVRRIYGMFLKGMTPHGIAKTLTDEGVPTPAGKHQWGQTTIKSILSNEKYKGDALLQKTFCEDFLTKKMKTNQGEVPQYYVENNHEAIIDPETFEMVQRELARRTKGKNRHSGVHLLSGRIKCGDCGGWYGSKVWHSPEKCKRTVWQCNQKYKNEVRCTTPYLDEASVKERFTVAVNRLLSGRDAAIAAYEMGMAKTLDTTELEAQQQELLSEMEVLNGMIQQMIRQNATVAQDQTEYNKRFDALGQKFKEAEAKKDTVAQQISDIRDRRGTMEDFLRILKQQDGEVTEFSEQFWCGLLDYATAYADGRLTFTFKNGSTFEG